MAYTTLINDIKAVIKNNGNQEITGQVLQTALVEMVNELGSGYTYKGVATLSTTPDVTTPNIFYLLGAVGTYTNIGGIQHASGIGIAIWNGSAWSYQNVPASAIVVTDATITANSTNPVQSGAVASALNDYYVNEEVTINNNSQRNKNYNLTSGSKIAVRVSLVSGTSKTFNLNWIKAGGNVSILSGYPLGYLTEVYEVPSDATGLNIFITPSASGNKAKVEIFKADSVSYMNAALTKNVNGFEYINNRKIYTATANVEVSSSAQYIVSENDARLLSISGNFYAFVQTTATFANTGQVRFTYSDNSVFDFKWLGRNKAQFLKCGEGGKTLRSVMVLGDSIETSGDVSVTLFATNDDVDFLRYPLKNKKIACFGDSITEFNNTTDTKRYSDWLSQISLATLFNFGIGGTQLSARDTLSLSPSSNQQAVAAFDMVSLIEAWATNDYQYQDAAIASGKLTSDQQSLYTTKLANIKATPISTIDIVTIWGGTNDYTAGKSIGSTALSNTDRTTICGAINKIAEVLYTANPTLRICAFTPIPRMFNSTISNATISDVWIPDDAPEGKSLPDVGDIIATQWKYNHIPVDNWYWEFGWNAYNWTVYFSDYTHPQLGFEIIARKIYQFILDNPIGK